MQDEHINQIISKAEKEREEKFQKEAEIQSLKMKYTHLVEKKEHLLEVLQKHALYDELMEGVVHITQVLLLSNTNMYSNSTSYPLSNPNCTARVCD